jgi:hypothetical protein
VAKAEGSAADRVTEIEAGLGELVGVALRAASTPEELVDVAHAAAALADPHLLGEVVERVAEEVERALQSSGAWEAELTYNKIEAWSHTGHKARLLAEAWGAVRGSLTAGEPAAPRRSARR